MLEKNEPLEFEAGQEVEAKLTPLMQQYWQVKNDHPDKIVLFRMGDFFEMFYRDAETAAPILNIALTSRNKKAKDETPMCGVPHHSVGNVINKLLMSGNKVAICDQIEDPKHAKGIVKRAVTRVLSPGVVYDPELLAGGWAHYIFAQCQEAISFLDTTTGEAFYYRVPKGDLRDELLLYYQPIEEIVPREDILKADLQRTTWLKSGHDRLSGQEAWPKSARQLHSYFATLQGEKTKFLVENFELRNLQNVLEMRPVVLRHLEIFVNQKGEKAGGGTLIRAIDRTQTSGGSRTLKAWIQFPLTDVERIQARQTRVHAWLQASQLRTEIRRALLRVGDLERRISKLTSPSCHPRDLLSLAEALCAADEAFTIAKGVEPGLGAESLVLPIRECAERIGRTVRIDAPVLFKSGGVIQQGVSSTLDELINIAENSSRMVLDLELREKERTGIASLKVRYNQVFGYYIEITHTHRDKVPANYLRKQTLTNAERYTTDELQDLERKVLASQTQRLELEEQIFSDLVKDLLLQTPQLLSASRVLSDLDVVVSLAHLAQENNYVCPEFVDQEALRIRSSRHPVIEQFLGSGRFIANDVHINRGQCILLTGPNMAGKSTLMRQVALTVILAQVGSFVPASEARLPVFDKIFTRIGASDSLSEGLSTFMVEMKEAAEILSLATSKSLVVLDEIGRGTSTYDGLSLAQSILEYIMADLGATTLFATHYHEIVALVDRYAQLKCQHMRIAEDENGIIFLHQLADGPANRSYGIHVASLAGLPISVLKRAEQILSEHEASEKPVVPVVAVGPLRVRKARRESTPQFNLFDPPVLNGDGRENIVVKAVRQVDLNQLTPIEALNRIAKWQKELF